MLNTQEEWESSAEYILKSFMCLFYNVGRGEDLTEKMSFEE
jgi:hypothetical protein